MQSTSRDHPASLDLSNESIGLHSTPTYKLVSKRTEDLITEISNLNEGTININPHPKIESLEESLFNATAEAKVEFSKLAMYFPIALRTKLFHQIDLIHDEADWDEDELPIQLSSLLTFLRWFYVSKPARFPNFGLTNDGHLVASWLTNSNNDKLILEYYVSDSIKWFVEKRFGDEIDYTNGVTKLSRANDVLAPYHSSFNSEVDE